MTKLSTSQKKNCVAGARPAASIGSYLKILRFSTLFDIGIGLFGGIMNITSSILSSKRKPTQQEYYKPEPKTRNVANKTLNINM